MNDEEWSVEMYMGIDELRMLYSHVCYAIDSWPGYPKRPLEEQEYLYSLKSRLFAMLTAVSYTHLTLPTIYSV